MDNHSKEYNMKIQYENELVIKLGIGYPKTFVCQFIYHENDNDDTKIIQKFIMHGMGLCIKLDSFMAHMLYSWSFSHNTAVLIAIKKNKFFLSLNTNTNVFD